MARLVKAYKQIRIGDPLDDKTLCGPLHSPAGIKLYENAIKEIQEQGGKILYGGKVLTEMHGNYVTPTITSLPHSSAVVQDEVFVPILHTFKIKVLYFLVKILTIESG